MTHDVADANEWYGLVSFERFEDRYGRVRPALATMWAWHRAVLVEPVDGPVKGHEVDVAAFVEERGDFQVMVSRAGAPPVPVPTIRRGTWITGRFELPADARGPQRLLFTIVHGEQAVARTERVVLPAGQAPVLRLALAGAGASLTLSASLRDETQRAIAGAEVRVGLLEASGNYDRTLFLKTGEDGVARTQIWVPPPPARFVVVGAWNGSEGETPLAYDVVVGGEVRR